MKYQVHIAIQIVPISKEHPYPIIDKAIEVIKNSGVENKVGAMETMMQRTLENIPANVLQNILDYLKSIQVKSPEKINSAKIFATS